MGALLLITLTCLFFPPLMVVAFVLAGGVFATVGLYLLGFAGAVITVVGLFLLPVVIDRLRPRLPADLH